MSKINKIKVNGTPYEVEDKEAVKTVTLTQEEYDALQTKDPSIFYVISDGQGGGGGMTSGEVQTMIDSSISGKADSSGVTQEISAATSGKVDTTTFNTYSGAVDTALSGKQETLLSGTNIKTINNESLLGSGNITISGGGSGSSAVEVTQAEYDALVSGGTLDPSVLYIITDAVGGDLSNYMTSAQTMNAISAATSIKQDILSAGTGIDITDNTISVTGGGITSGEVQDMIDESISGKVDTSTFNTYSGAVDTTLSGKQDTLSAGTNITITDNVISAQLEGGTVSRGDVEDMIEEATSGLVETSAVTSSVTSASTDTEIPTAKAVYDSISGKQDTILGLWSEAPYRSVSIGYDNNNSVNCQSSLAVGDSNTIGSGTRASIAVGEHNTVGGYLTRFGMYVFGGYCNATNNYSLANGYYVNTDNLYEAGFGTYNKTTFDYTKPFGDSGNTLFSVGNGTANNARHNAFEIKQNGDIYITSGSTDIKLQDHLGGGGGGGLDDDTQLLLSTALTDLNDRKADLSEVRQNYQRKGDYATKSELAAKANVSDVMTLEKAKENEQVTSYALNNLNDKFGGMKLVKITESEYAALTTKDENTLYVVIADPE